MGTGTSYETVNGASITTSLRISILGKVTLVIKGGTSRADVIEADIEACNGIMHIIDAVLLPPLADPDDTQEDYTKATLPPKPSPSERGGHRRLQAGGTQQDSRASDISYNDPVGSNTKLDENLSGLQDDLDIIVPVEREEGIDVDEVDTDMPSPWNPTFYPSTLSPSPSPVTTPPPMSRTNPPVDKPTVPVLECPPTSEYKSYQVTDDVTFDYAMVPSNPPEANNGILCGVLTVFTDDISLWTGFGISESGGMVGSDAILYNPTTQSQYVGLVGKYDLNGKSPSTVVPMNETSQTLRDADYSIDPIGGSIEMSFTKLL